MQTQLNPYLSFKDNAREAMEFYQTVFGGKLAISTFKEYHASQDPSEDNKAELQGYFEKLLVGGNVTMPLEEAPWGDTFGMLTDKFGVPWLVNIAGHKA